MATVDVFILEDHTIQVFINDATEAEAVEISKKVMKDLELSGLKFESIEEPEFHRNGGDHVHVINKIKNREVHRHGQHHS